MSPPSTWKQGPSFVDTFRKLRELSVRVQRLVLAEKIGRAKIMLTALAPGSQEPPRV